jgi:hypothetical protein
MMIVTRPVEIKKAQAFDLAGTPTPWGAPSFAFFAKSLP